MFRDDFIWGVASAAYQIEGAAYEDGKGEGTWDYFSKNTDRVAHNETGEVACDHYHRYKEDVALMKQLGVKSYRFSISWPRVIPNGIGEVNEKGLQFYSDLVDEIIAAGITPMITLHHWNYPMALYNKGGWKNDESSEWFAEYVRLIIDRLSDRVKYWMTFNEPQLFIGFSLHKGMHAPFETNNQADMMKIYRNAFLAHGKAVKIIRNNAKLAPVIGMAPTGPVVLPKDDTTEAIEAARKASFSIDANNYSMSNAWWADPIMLGRFPEEAAEIFGDDLPKFSAEEWALISQPLDFYGFNVYQAQRDKQQDINGYDEYSYMGSPRTAMKWNVTPSVMYYSSKFLYERYKTPLLITENGMANVDWVSLDGKVHDPQRIDFLHRYLLELEKATDAGIPIIGYQYWSVMDNYEWTCGYDERFGLIYVDYPTQKRTLKDSAYWYSEVIKTNGKSLH